MFVRHSLPVSFVDILWAIAETLTNINGVTAAITLEKGTAETVTTSGVQLDTEQPNVGATSKSRC